MVCGLQFQFAIDLTQQVMSHPQVLNNSFISYILYVYILDTCICVYSFQVIFNIALGLSKNTQLNTIMFLLVGYKYNLYEYI